MSVNTPKHIIIAKLREPNGICSTSIEQLFLDKYAHYTALARALQYVDVRSCTFYRIAMKSDPL